MSVVTRFAPSPTGFLHIGGARTALFNWLFARGRGGKFLLRIEDTDRARSTEAAIGAIIDGMDWLGLKADEPPIFQFARATRHQEVAAEMVARGGAFKCFMTPEEVEVERASAQAEGRAFRSTYRNGKAAPAVDAPHVVRLRAPDDGEIVNDDLVQGPVRVKARDIDDLVLLRADGTPTYMHAVVVDDHDMAVTHVIRGDDHLTNAARQIPIYQAMGWSIPAFAHVPMIHGPDGAKLSKRHGAQAIQDFRDMGYLPEAMRNYLIRLGWSHGDHEIMSMDDAARWFDLAQVGKSPARLDFAKLASVNSHYMKDADDARLFDLALEFGTRARDWSLTAVEAARVRAAMPILKARAKTIAELTDQAAFLIARRPVPLDEKARSVLKDDAKERLRRLAARLADAPSWDEAELAALVKAFAADEGVSMGQIGPAVRAALTGGAPAPDLPQTLALLGRDETMGRVADVV
jgi:glutamyl-tRNA synthetase